MATKALLLSWLTELRGLELSEGDGVNRVATENEMLYEMAAARSAGATSVDLVDFLVQAHRAYSVAASYADSEHELPFGCKLSLTRHPQDLAAVLTDPRNSDVIEWRELEDVSFDHPEPEFGPLVVFVRDLIVQT